MFSVASRETNPNFMNGVPELLILRLLQQEEMYGYEIVQAIRDTKIKVQTQIQDRQIRVTGKDRDALQEVIAFLRGKDFPVALNYTNFRA